MSADEAASPRRRTSMGTPMVSSCFADAGSRRPQAGLSADKAPVGNAYIAAGLERRGSAKRFAVSEGRVRRHARRKGGGRNVRATPTTRNDHHGLRHRTRDPRQRSQRRHRRPRPRPSDDQAARRASAPPLPGERRGPPRPPPGDAHADRPPPRVVPRRVELLDVALPRDRERGAHADAFAPPPSRARRRGARLGGARDASRP